jgi:beta-phosphoglucomutase family hydrolase
VLAKPTLTISRRDFDAAIFDVDGVLTDTARVHAAAWKAVFDPLLQRWAIQHHASFTPFGNADYLAYVDGRPRYEGIRSFLTARGISLPEGSEHDCECADTVRGLGERKTRLFCEALHQGVAPARGAQSLLRRLRQAGVRIAAASSSKNCAAVLSAAGLDHLIDARVDGLDAETLGFAGKPDPGLFLEAARRLHVEPSRAVLFEDALAGVEAGRRARFAKVIGIDRGHQSKALRERGADLVIESLEEVDAVQT